MEKASKHIKLKVPAKATVWYIGSGALARAIGALSTPIFTRLLTPEEYGLYPLYNSWIGVLSVIITLELTGGVIYRGLQKHSHIKDGFVSATFGLLGVIFFGFCALYFALYRFIGLYTGLNIKISILMMLQIFATAILSLYLAKARFEYRYKVVAALNIASALLMPFVAITIVFMTAIRAEARIYAASLTSLIISIPIAYAIIKSSEKLYNKDIWRYLIRHAIPLLPHYLASSLILKIGEISISKSFGTEMLGRYSIAISVGMVLTVVTGGLLSALTPWMIRKIREGGIKKIQEFLLLSVKGLSLLSLAILAFTPEVMSLMATEGFRSALPAVYPLEIAVVFSFLSGAIMSACSYYERGAISSLPSIASASVSAILSILVLPNVDYRFAGLFALISYIVLSLCAALVFKHLSGDLPISIKKCAGIFLLTALYAALLLSLSKVIISRVFLVIPLLPLLYFTGKEIIEKIRE